MRNFLKPLLFAGISVCTLSSCDDDNTTVPAPENIYEFVSADADLTNLKSCYRQSRSFSNFKSKR